MHVLPAQSLLMDLLSAVGGHDVPVRALVRAAEVFGISENNLRVALARLLSAGKIERTERGSYGIAERARAVHVHVTSWSELESRCVPWKGGWVGVHTLRHARGRTANRRLVRTLSFVGLAELVPDLWVRPDNLSHGVPGVRERLARFGLEPRALVFALGDLDSGTEARARGLWDAAAITRGYETTRLGLVQSGERLAELPLERAMVECFVLGGQAIRQLAFDPLLPEPIVSAAARDALIDEMRRYDRMGRRIWRKFMIAEGAPALESLLEFRALGDAA